jgi:hypothetical protein
MWKLRSKLAIALLVGASAACSDNATPTAPVIPAFRDVGISTATVTPIVYYQATCVLKLREIGGDAVGDTPVKVDGVGQCSTHPFERADVKFEGWKNERDEKFVIEGGFVYQFSDGSRLFSRVTMGSAEVVALSGGLMYVTQSFTRGTGKFAAVRGGSGYGSGTMYEPGYRATYFLQGNIMFASEPAAH